VTTGTFLAMSVYGTVTKRDSPPWQLPFMGLIGIVIASLVNIFLKSSMMDFIIRPWRAHLHRPDRL